MELALLCLQVYRIWEDVAGTLFGRGLACVEFVVGTLKNLKNVEIPKPLQDQISMFHRAIFHLTK